jgi:hypothetical protein
MPERDPSSALSLVLRSVDALRNARALFVLLGTFATAGILVAMAEASLARDAGWWGPLQAGAALFVAFYGGNAAGILVMDDARGRPVREVPDALRSSLTSAHRLLLALALLLCVYAGVAAMVLGLFWLSRVAVTGPWLGPLLFGLAVPIGVVVFGLAAVTLMTVVVPLAAPAVWSGAGVAEIVAGLARVMRRRLPTAALLAVAVSLLTAATGALVTSVVTIGSRVVAEIGVRVVGVDVPAQQLTAGLFGYGLRSLGAAGAPVGSTGHAAAALVGGGVVFAIALLLPGLVYLRGTCAAYLALTDDPAAP